MAATRALIGVALLTLGACTARRAEADVDAQLLADWHGAAMLAGQPRTPCDSVTVGLSVAQCGTPTPIAPAAIATYASAATAVAQRTARTPRDVQRLARIDVALNATDPRTLTRVLATLTESIRASTAPVDLLVDHSAVALQRFAVMHESRDLFAGLESASRALERDSTRRDAAYNRALALTWAGMRVVTRQAWATHRKLTNDRARPVLVDPAAYGTDEAIALNGAWREATREYAWNVALPRFGAALHGGDPDSIRVARVTLDSLAVLASRDSLDHDISELRDALLTAHAARDTARVRQQWQAIDRYRWAHSAEGRQSVTIAMRVIDSLLAQPTLQPALRRWAMMEHVNQLLVIGRSTEAVAQFAALERQMPAQTRIYGIRARAGGAMTHTSLGRSAEGVSRMQVIERECVRARLETCELSMAAFGAMTGTILGDLPATDAATVRTMRALSRAPRSLWYWSAAFLFQDLATLYGFPRAADTFDAEALDVAVAIGRVDLATEIAQEQAEAAVLRGDSAAAVRYMRAFREQWLPRQTAEDQAWSRVDVLRIEAMLARDTRPAASVAMLDTALQLTAQDNNDSRRTPIRIEHAMSLLASNAVTCALTELDAITRVLRARGSEHGDVFDAARLARVMERVSLTSAQTLRRSGRARQALLALNGEPFLTEVDGTHPGSATMRALAVRMVDDSAWVWRPSGDTLALTVVALPAKTIRQTRALDPEALQRVYEAVLAPVLESGVVTAVCLDVRGAMAQVPWAAMRRRDRRFLVQDTQLLHVQDAQRGCDAGRTLAPTTPVQVVDAAPDSGARALPASKREVAVLQQLWGPMARVMDASRGSASTLRAMTTASVVHFVGHAMLNRERPDRSYLWLGAGADSMITGATIAAQRFRQQPIVILGACDAGAGSDNVFGGFDSLAGAFLGAGARSVIGAAWPVDDTPTGELMLAVHTALRAGAAPAEALRQAQVMALQSRNPALRTPRVWAAFQVMQH